MVVRSVVATRGHGGEKKKKRGLVAGKPGRKS